MKTSQPGLAALIYPKTLPDFFSHYEENRPLLVHHGDQSIQALVELPFLDSLEALLNSWPYPIQAHLPDVRDEASSIETTNKDARKLFSSGMGLLFNEAHEISPVLNQWLEAIGVELGLSAMTIRRCLIYATPDGKGSAPHFDQNINFVLQLHGVKKWWMAPNKQVVNPLSRHTMGLEADPELMSYLESPLPETMPSDAECFELRPGSLLFVPRGYWHATQAQGDALALNFTFTAPSWLDLLTAALRSRLAQSPEWRVTADGVSDPKRLALAENHFDHLLSDLIEELTHWNGPDILKMTESNRD